MKGTGKRERDGAGSAISVDETLRVQGAIVSFVAAHEDGHLTITLVVGSLAAELGEGTSRTAIEAAVRDLVGAGILRCENGLLKAAH
jgi:hypothetical protein